MIELTVCIGSACHVKGSYNVMQMFQQMIEENSLHEKIDFKSAFCMKQCQSSGVAVQFDGKTYGVTPEAAKEFFKTTVMPMIK